MKSFHFKQHPKFQTFMVFYNLYVHIFIINACLFSPIVLLFWRVTTCKQISFQPFKKNKVFGSENIWNNLFLLHCSHSIFYKTKFFVIEYILKFCFMLYLSQFFCKYRFLSLHEMIWCSYQQQAVYKCTKVKILCLSWAWCWSTCLIWS